MKYEEIMQAYKEGNLTQDQAIDRLTEAFQAGEVTREDLNAGLKELAAGYSFQELTEEERAAKREREDEEGFLPAREEAKVLPRTTDMRRRKDLAGQVVIQEVKSGYFAVFYDENGYATKARRVTFAS